MSTEPGKPVATKLSSQMNHPSICETVIAAFVLDAMLASLELTFSRTMHVSMLQRLFETSVQPNTCNSFSWPAYSLDMSPIEHMWNLIGWSLARDLRAAASKHEPLLRIQIMCNSLPQADI
ncbi:transposable element Tcb2 transposase [Trichonephila clavipes]|nr:transposable element Tcb2 transposase [Trichonephila clavipes]